jgi:hypothetical protein
MAAGDPSDNPKEQRMPQLVRETGYCTLLIYLPESDYLVHCKTMFLLDGRVPWILCCGQAIEGSTRLSGQLPPAPQGSLRRGWAGSAQ